MSEPSLRVVAAAVRLSNGLVICGVRHFDGLMRAVIEQLDGSTAELVKGAIQGFVLSNYRFVDRDVAFKIANEAGQILEGEGRHGQLYSEDVW